MASDDVNKFWVTAEHVSIGKVGGYVDESTKTGLENHDPDTLEKFQRDIVPTFEVFVQPGVSGNEPSTSTSGKIPDCDEIQEIKDAFWTETKIKALMATYIENKEKKLSWRSFAKELRKVIPRDIPLDDKLLGDKCRLKIRGLQDKFQRLTTKLNKSGASGSPIPNELEDAFGSEGNEITVRPINSSTFVKKDKLQKDDTIDAVEDEGQAITHEEPKPKRQKSNFDRMMSFMKEERETREKILATQHQEKMEIMRGLIAVLANRK